MMDVLFICILCVFLMLFAFNLWTQCKFWHFGIIFCIFLLVNKFGRNEVGGEEDLEKIVAIF